MSSSQLFRRLKDRLLQWLITLPWLLVGGAMRFLYGFRVEGEEHVPAEGPFIVLQSEFSMICFLMSGWSSIILLKGMAMQSPDKVISYLQEQLLAFSYFRSAADQAKFMRALIPHSAGRLALNLMDGYKVLRKGGVVLLNPEGDMTWDGRPIPIGSAAAWLGLHTAAPLVPMIPAAGAYDIWPRWKVLPGLRGRATLRVGQPFSLCDAPQARVTDEDLQRANARIRQQFDRLRYGPDGLSGWIGTPRRNGAPLEQPVRLLRRPELAHVDGPERRNPAPLWRRGIGLVLWQCPVCGTDDALVHRRPWFQPQRISCQSCDTRWQVKRVVGGDFRLEVVEGPSDLLGLEMPLSTWYDELKRDFQPSPISASGVDLSPGEEVYLQVDAVSLAPHRPNPLFDGWTGREPPRAQPAGPMQLADWPSIGHGQLLLTNYRLLWRGPQGELDFEWSSVTAVYLWLLNTLGLRYGTAPYRFSLGQEVGLKWLTYAATMATQAAQREGRTVTTSTF